MTRRSPGDGTLFQRKSDLMWIAGYTVLINGKPVKKRVSSKTRNGAINKRNELKKQLDAGIVPGAISISLHKWLDHWLTIKKPKVDPTTYRSYELAVRYIEAAIGPKMRLDKLAPDDVRAMHTTLQTTSVKWRKASTRTAQKAHTILSMALKDAMAELGLTRNVAELVGAPGHLAKRHPAFTPKQALHIMATADTSCDETWAARWRAGFMTGKRECEVLGLTWDRVDFAQDLLYIEWQLQELTKTHGCGEQLEDKSWPCGKKKPTFCPDAYWDFAADFEHELCEGNLVWTRPKSKNTEDVPIPIIAPLHEILAQLKATDGINPHNLVFHHPDGSPISQSQDQKAWQRLLRAAGVEHVRQHTLRRTTATLMRAAEVDEQTRMELFGHGSEDVQRRYADPNVARHREAMGRLADILAPQDLDGQ